MNYLKQIEQKIVDLSSLIHLIKKERASNKKIVFTNGCFDILHRGHLTYLAQTADLGDLVIVGLNTDASVKRQGKDINRPINDEQSRAFILAGLSVVDFVVLFDEDTPLNLLKEILPDVLVKGGDYDAEEMDKNSKKYIIGTDVVLNNGGTICTIPLVQGFSTTNIVKTIQKGK
jgi:rfaE bifunctional protein nucleotidyltransferase chain/domain